VPLPPLPVVPLPPEPVVPLPPLPDVLPPEPLLLPPLPVLLPPDPLPPLPTLPPLPALEPPLPELEPPLPLLPPLPEPPLPLPPLPSLLDDGVQADADAKKPAARMAIDREVRAERNIWELLSIRLNRANEMRPDRKRGAVKKGVGTRNLSHHHPGETGL
jgi:hypothetical protein